MKRLHWLGMIAVASIPLSAQAQDMAEDSIPSPTEAEPIAEEEPDDEEWREEALSSYEKRALFSTDGGDIDWAPPTQGTAVEPLGAATFYEIVGKPGYASQYRTNRAIRYGIIGAGSAIAIGSLVYGVSGSDSAVDTEGPEEDGNDSRLLVGLIGSLLGVGVAVSSTFLTVDPVSMAERRELEQNYNDSLLEELGLFPGEVQWLHDERAVRQRAQEDNGAEVSLAPLIGGENRGLALFVSF
ncbi:MAG: hypothetical protein AAFU77_00355 [Myxococcota bacterium]